jgi:hypothetical protein
MVCEAYKKDFQKALPKIKSAWFFRQRKRWRKEAYFGILF